MEKIIYHSFLLMLCIVKQNGKFSWRASLTNPLMGQQQFFDCLEDLFAFFQELKKAHEDENGLG